MLACAAHAYAWALLARAVCAPALKHVCAAGQLTAWLASTPTWLVGYITDVSEERAPPVDDRVQGSNIAPVAR